MIYNINMYSKISRLYLLNYKRLTKARGLKLGRYVNLVYILFSVKFE